MSKVYIDTNILIYILKNEISLRKEIKAFVELCELNNFEILTCDITITEFLTGIFKHNGEDLFGFYANMFEENELFKTVSISKEAYRMAARLRVLQNLKTPDSLHLATALYEKCTFFVTQDQRIGSHNTIQVVTLAQFNEAYK
jgi:predicted nucleic acid-binding protein